MLPGVRSWFSKECASVYLCYNLTFVTSSLDSSLSPSIYCTQHSNRLGHLRHPVQCAWLPAVTSKIAMWLAETLAMSTSACLLLLFTRNVERNPNHIIVHKTFQNFIALCRVIAKSSRMHSSNNFKMGVIRRDILRHRQIARNGATIANENTEGGVLSYGQDIHNWRQIFTFVCLLTRLSYLDQEKVSRLLGKRHYQPNMLV